MAVGVSASRRTDIPALFCEWFLLRLEAGFVEYIPAGPPRRVRRSIRPEDVTHFNFWSKWPRPFFGALDRVLEIGYPVLWNVTITGLGGTAAEPRVPPAEKVVAATVELSGALPPGAILWRYDPILVSRRFDLDHHVRTFRSLAEALAGRVDRVTMSFIEPYRRVRPNLDTYERESGDRLLPLPLSGKLDLLGHLREIAAQAGIPFTICCSREDREGMGCERAGCNNWGWVSRIYPELRPRPRPKDQPTRDDCACSREIDIGVYNTCILGCPYSYGTCNLAKAQANFAMHIPGAPCLLA